MNTRTLLLHFLIFSFSILSLPTVATAQDTDEDEEMSEETVDRGAEYYEEALDAYSNGDFLRAAELLERAFAHDQNLVYKYNQVLAYQGAGEFEKALRVLDIYGDPMDDDGRFTDIAYIHQELDDAIVQRDEREAAEEEARLAALAEDEDEDEDDEVEIDEPQILEPPEQSNTVPYALIGTGGAVFATGLLFSSGVLIDGPIDRLERSRTSSESEAIYNSGDFNRDDDLSTLRTHQTMSILFLASGVVLGATGGTLLFLSGSGDSDSSSAMNFQPTISRDAAGASISGRF